MLNYNPRNRDRTHDLLRNILTLDKNKRQQHRKNVKEYTYYKIGKKLPDTIK